MKRISQGATLRAFVAGGACASLLVLAACGSDDTGGSSGGGSAATEKRTVVFMAPNTTPTRYIQQDGPAFEKAMKALDPNIR